MSAFDVTDFEQQVLERSHEIPVLVDFWAAWCGPCRALGPVLEALANQNEGRWELRKLDTERFPQIAQRYGIRSIPAVKLFVDGRVADEFVGALPEPGVRAWLERALPSPWRGRVEAAREHLQQGRAEQAEALLRELLAEHDDPEARLLLAQAVMFSDPAEALQWLEPLGLASPQGQRAEALRLLAGWLQQEPEDLPGGRGKGTFIRALDALRRQSWEEALRGFIELVLQDRGYLDDAGRRACLALFELLGPEHELTRRYRTEFSNAVYA